MSIVPFAVAEAAVAQPGKHAGVPKTPPKRRTAAVADRKLAPEPR